MEQRVKPRRAGSGSGLFLIELMIAILFFSLASAVCMQLFARAHLIARESRDLGEAVNRAQTAAEYFKTSEGSGERLAELLDTQPAQELSLWYDEDWNRLDENGAPGACYRMTVLLGGEAPLATARICVESLSAQASGEIYTLQAADYLPAQAG